MAPVLLRDWSRESVKALNPFNAPGSPQAEQQRIRRERVKFVVWTIVVANVLLLMGLLIQGCNGNRQPTKPQEGSRRRWHHQIRTGRPWRSRRLTRMHQPYRLSRPQATNSSPRRRSLMPRLTRFRGCQAVCGREGRFVLQDRQGKRRFDESAGGCEPRRGQREAESRPDVADSGRASSRRPRSAGAQRRAGAR